MAAAALFLGQQLQAATVVFDNNASFDNNFFKPSAPTGSPLLLQTADSLHFSPLNGQTNATAIYNTNTTGGSGGSGGTTMGLPLDTFTIDSDGLLLQADFKADRFDGANGLGFYFGLDSTGAHGEAALFRLATVTGGPGTPDVRFCTNTDATAAANVGSVGSSNSFGGTIIDLSVYYTFQLTLTLSGANVLMVAKVFDAATFTQIGSTVTSSIPASSITTSGGQVGFRLGGVQNSSEDVANFIVTPVPESSVMALVLLGLMVTVFRIPRTRKS